MIDTDVKLELERTFLRKGNYEGHDYYQLIATTPEGFTLKARLTAFEYNSVMKALHD